MSKSLHHQIAVRAQKIVADKDRWIQGPPYATTRKGRELQLEDRGAYRFCMVGALQRAAHEVCTGDDLTDVIAGTVHEKIERFAKIPNGRFENLEAFNDSRRTTHADVLKLFDAYLAAN